MTIPSDPGFYQHLLNRITDGVYFVDCDRRILYWNDGAFRLTGYTPDELVGRRCQDGTLCHVDYEGRQLCQTGCPLSASMVDGKERTAKMILRNKQGGRLPVSVRSMPMYGADGSIIGAIEVFNDDSANIEAARKADALQRMAFLDHVTQAPNRRYMELGVRTALSEYELQQVPFGLLMIDIDQFKQMNDSFGHASGDSILREAAHILATSLRPNDVVGRWGGDEFVGIARSVPPGILKELAERCVAVMARTAITLESGSRLALGISVGATMVRSGDSAESLILRADELLYRSKAEGRCRATVA